MAELNKNPERLVTLSTPKPTDARLREIIADPSADLEIRRIARELVDARTTLRMLHLDE